MVIKQSQKLEVTAQRPLGFGCQKPQKASPHYQAFAVPIPKPSRCVNVEVLLSCRRRVCFPMETCTSVLLFFGGCESSAWLLVPPTLLLFFFFSLSFVLVSRAWYWKEKAALDHFCEHNLCLQSSWCAWRKWSAVHLVSDPAIRVDCW